MAQALLEGNVDIIFVNSSEDIVRQLDARKFRPLAAAPEERAPYFPETQALKELGYKTLTLATSFFALGAPAGMPEDTTAKLKETPQAALETPEVREELGETLKSCTTSSWARRSCVYRLEEIQAACLPILTD
jgi:tripartite-type tricarboxylate transporter receptor subunit TctC